jgi:hypothetical protein
MKCFTTTRLSNTDSNVADVATMSSTVAVTDDRIGDRICAGCGFLFSLVAFSSPLQILLGQVLLRPDPDAPHRFCLSDRWKDNATPRQRSA